jgi:hypothetical protein
MAAGQSTWDVSSTTEGMLIPEILENKEKQEK